MLLPLLCVALAVTVLGDDFVVAPHQSVGATGAIYPFLIKETTQFTTNVPTMRYQQVFNSSLFTNVSPGSVYVTTLTFYGDSVDPPSVGWTIPSMQINFSTTTNTADNLSSVFAQNVGPDDTIVLDRGSYVMPLAIIFNRPFRYTPPLGNLLLDVRIFDGSGDPFPLSNPFPKLQGFNSSADEVSRVWSTNVVAGGASGSDTVGLKTIIELSPIPSLQAQFIPSMCAGCPTNVIVISWPSAPTNFVLQATYEAGSNASWKPATNQIFNSGGGRWIGIPAASAGAAAFYRLVWSNGYALTTTLTVPNPAASNTSETTH